MIYATDTAIAQLTPAVVDRSVSADGLQQLANDAAHVYAFLDANPWVADHDLRKWAEANDLPNERVNRALELLKRLGRIAALDVVGTPPSAPAPRRARGTRKR